MFIHHQVVLVMEAAKIFETSITFYQITLRYDLKDSHFQSRRRENLKFCLGQANFQVVIFPEFVWKI
jgi:hypothetical protein